MSTLIPQTDNDLHQLNGMTDAKVQKYGKNFLAVINDFIKRNKIILIGEFSNQTPTTTSKEEIKKKPLYENNTGSKRKSTDYLYKIIYY